MRGIASFILLITGAYSQELCMPDCSSGRCIFNVKVDLSAGEFGYYQFDGCDGVNPTLGMEIGVTHIFLQIHDHNYYHPLGFAYFPDGDHDGLAELEPSIPPPESGSACDTNMTCPAPMYFLNEKYLGLFSNDPDVMEPTTNQTDFGLDAYEPVFFYPYGQWVGLGNFSVNLRFDQYYNKDIFYFCHIHQFMSGRIKLLQNGVPTQADADLPEIPYDYNQPNEFDVGCGTFNLSDFQLPNPQCPDRFVCDPPEGSIGQFADCIEAQNCQMFIGMTTKVSARSVAALFMHQMIPHHVNAVHMAKSLLLHGDVECASIDDESPRCSMYKLGLSIVNSQNHQIQAMKSLLQNYGFPETDDCVVPVSGEVVDERDVRRLSQDQTNPPLASYETESYFGGDFSEPRYSAIYDETLQELNGNAFCISTTGQFTVRVNINAGELGYFTFDECGDTPNPTIGLEIGKTYVFHQSERTNCFHPMGFAYFPDGAHAGLEELEPGMRPYASSSACAGNLTCPAPMYVMNNLPLGKFSNIPDILEVSTGEDDFGLDVYEPIFFRPLHEWTASNYSIFLNFDVADFDRDLFYFCHIHEFMTGRIKLLKNGQPVSTNDDPAIPYKYDQPGDFDDKCGTFGLDSFQLPNQQCFDSFVCDVPDDDANLKQYSECIEAMNCNMLTGMTTKATSQSGIALFIHHMIPHHQNAVNMAKATLKYAGLVCDDLSEESDDCILENILREIINGQNYEIQLMRGVLEDLQLPPSDDCVVNITSQLEDNPGTSGFPTNHVLLSVVSFAAAIGQLVLFL